MDTTTLAIMVAIIPAAAIIVSQAVQQIIGIVRSKSDHAHELRRDQLARDYKFHLQEYCERSEACQSLMLAIFHVSLRASTRQSTAEFWPQLDLAQKILNIDERAAKVRQKVGALPVNQLYANPNDPDVIQAWNAATAALSAEVFDYLRVLREGLIPTAEKYTTVRQS